MTSGSRDSAGIVNVNYFRQASISLFFLTTSYIPEEQCSHGQKLSILWRRVAIFARTAGPRRNIELALWIRYQEKETEVPVEPAGVRTVFYCGIIEPTERRRKRSQIVDGHRKQLWETSHDANVECLPWFSIKLTTLRNHKIFSVVPRHLMCFFFQL